MSRIKGDVNIGRRAFEFFNLQPEGAVKACAKANIPHQTVYDWANGMSTPSAYYLQKLCFLGADINYILTEKRSNNNDR